MSMLAIGVTGLNAAQLGLITTEHNITNANTEGYNRQRTIQSTNIPLGTGSGFLGQGVHVETVQRLYNGFVAGQVAQSATRASELDTYLDEITLIDNMLADPNSGLSPALQDFFRGVQQVTADPASLPARQSMVSATESLVSRFQSIEARFSEQYSSINEQIISRVDIINSYARQIADVNQRIIAASAATAQPPNDLLDQRDTLIGKLNEEIRVSTVQERDGSLSVFIGSGQQLVVGAQVSTLAAQPSQADPERFTVAIMNRNIAQELPEELLNGGALGGLLRFRRESLDLAANSLGRVAATIALTFNAQHALGQDLLGNAADAATPAFVADYFQMMSPRVVSNALNNPAPALSIDVQYIQPPPMIFNNGDYTVTYDPTADLYFATSQKYNIPAPPAAGAVVGADLSTVLASLAPAIDLASGHYVTDLTLSDYQIQFDPSGNNFTITRISDNLQVVPLTAVGTLGPWGDTRLLVDGISIDITGAGAANANSTFQVQPTREFARNLELNPSIAADPRLIAAAGPVRTELSPANTGSGKIDLVSVQDGYTRPATATPLQLTFNGTDFVFSAAAGTVTVTAGGVPTAYALPATVPYTPDAIISFNGMNFQMSGAPKNGDVFIVQRNTNAVSDGRNALALGKLQMQETMAGGTTTYQGAYGQMVSQIGNQTREVQVTGEAQQSLLDQAVAAREAMSGVNLDEEAANLIRYQQAYQAAARVIDVGSRLFDVLMSMGR